MLYAMTDTSLASLLDIDPTPVQEVHDPLLARHGVRLLVKRDDLTHPLISGNKWRKLKFNLIEARSRGYDTLLTFGGAYSNHIHAVAAAGRVYGFSTVGVIRGEPYEPLNPTLRFASGQGMRLHYMERVRYRDKYSATVLEQLTAQYGDHYLLPEGGTNALALQGVAEMVGEVEQQTGGDYDLLCCACGTGGTLAGLIAGMGVVGKWALGVAVLKGAEFLQQEVVRLLQQVGCGSREWRVLQGYHFGGYARIGAPLIEFVRRFHRRTGIELEPVYTGKMMFALYDQIEKGVFSRGTTIVAMHSGGLQGWQGITARYGIALQE